VELVKNTDMIALKANDLNIHSPFMASFRKLIHLPFQASFSLRLKRIADCLEAEGKTLEAMFKKVEAETEWVTESAEGAPAKKVPKDVAQYETKVRAILDEAIELPKKKIDFDMIKNAQLTGADIINLSGLLTNIPEEE